MRDTKWKNSFDLTLGEMVNDIIHVDNERIANYVINKIEGNV